MIRWGVKGGRRWSFLEVKEVMGSYMKLKDK